MKECLGNPVPYVRLWERDLSQPDLGFLVRVRNESA